MVTFLPTWFVSGLLGPSGAKLFAFFVFTSLIHHPTSGPFGDPLSGLPERGERATASSQTAHPSCPARAEKLSRSVVPNGNPLGGLLLSPPNPLRWALAGTPRSRPLETCFDTGERRGDVLTLYEFALVQLTRFRPVRGVRKRTVSTDSCVLRPDGDAQHRRKKCPWGTVPRSRYCLRFPTAPQ